MAHKAHHKSRAEQFETPRAIKLPQHLSQDDLAILEGLGAVTYENGSQVVPTELEMELYHKFIKAKKKGGK